MREDLDKWSHWGLKILNIATDTKLSMFPGHTKIRNTRKYSHLEVIVHDNSLIQASENCARLFRLHVDSHHLVGTWYKIQDVQVITATCWNLLGEQVDFRKFGGVLSLLPIFHSTTCRGIFRKVNRMANRVDYKLNTYRRQGAEGQLHNSCHQCWAGRYPRNHRLDSHQAYQNTALRNQSYHLRNRYQLQD